MPQKKIKYEKPKSLDIGKVASVLGDVCSSGGAPTGPPGCGWGNDPEMIAYCPSGAQASSNCLSHGGTAAQFCSVGDAPGIACFAGGSFRD